MHPYFTQGMVLQKLRQKQLFIFKMAVDKGDEGAMRNFAVMLKKGDGVPENISEADHYFEMALYIRIARFILKISDKGNHNAMNKYGDMLYDGKIIALNKLEAARYFKMAADKGHPEAMNKYMYMLLQGDGIPYDKKEATRYIKIARCIIDS